jgi:hypothetical protein
MPVDAEVVRMIAEIERRKPAWSTGTNSGGHSEATYVLTGKCEDGTVIEGSIVEVSYGLLRASNFFFSQPKYGPIEEKSASLSVHVDGLRIWHRTYREGRYRGPEQSSRSPVDADSCFYLFDYIQKIISRTKREAEAAGKESGRTALERREMEQRAATERATKKFWRQ